MKLKKLTIHSVWMIFLVLSFASCKKDDPSYGTTNVYMPQASMTSDGAKGTFQVPSFGGAKNFTLDDAKTKLSIPLSVFRSGMEASGELTVNIKINTDTVAKFIASDKLNFPAILPADKYTIPTSVTIPSGSNVGVFELVVDFNYVKLNEGKNLLLAVEITNPSSSTLKQGKTITLINISTLLLASGPVVGKFNPTFLYYMKAHGPAADNVIGILGNSNNDNVVLQQQVKDPNNKYQQWQVIGLTSGNKTLYRFINRGSQKSIDVSDNLNPNWGWPNGATSGRYVNQNTASKTKGTQQWELIELDNPGKPSGQNVLVNRGLPGDKFIDLWGYDAVPGATNLSLLDWHNYDWNDVFHFEVIE